MKYKSFLILPKKVYIQEAAPQILTNLSSRHMLIFYARNRIFLLFDFPLWGLTPEYHHFVYTCTSQHILDTKL